jgi:hypothetical protein
MNVKVRGRKPSQQSAQTTAAGRMKCWIMKAGRQVRYSNVRLRSYETGLVAIRGKRASRSTTPVDISSAHQTQTRNVKTVRHDQRLHGPHPQHFQSLVLLSVGHATPHAVHTLVSFCGTPRSIPDPSILDTQCRKWRWVTHLAVVSIKPATLHTRPYFVAHAV